MDRTMRDRLRLEAIGELLAEQAARPALDAIRRPGNGTKVLAISMPAPPGRCHDLLSLRSDSLRGEILPPLAWDGAAH